MDDTRTSLRIDREKLFALLNPVFSSGGGSRPNPDEPNKPGPWDPVIRTALKDLSVTGPGPQPWREGPDPIPWRDGARPDPWTSSLLASGLLAIIARRFPQVWDVIGGGLSPADLAALNPQPLPPRERFVRAAGEALVARTEQIAEVDRAFGDGSEERGIIIVSGYINRLVDDWCGTGYRPRWPFPGPPPWWFQQEVGGRDIVVLGATLHEASRQAFDPVVRRALDDAAGKLAQVGLQRL